MQTSRFEKGKVDDENDENNYVAKLQDLQDAIGDKEVLDFYTKKLNCYSPQKKIVANEHGMKLLKSIVEMNNKELIDSQKNMKNDQGSSDQV